MLDVCFKPNIFFLPQSLKIHRIAAEERTPSLFLATNPTYSQTFRYLSGDSQHRLLNFSACYKLLLDDIYAP